MVSNATMLRSSRIHCVTRSASCCTAQVQRRRAPRRYTPSATVCKPVAPNCAKSAPGRWPCSRNRYWSGYRPARRPAAAGPDARSGSLRPGCGDRPPLRSEVAGRYGLEPSSSGSSPPARPTVAPGAVGRDGLEPSTRGSSPPARPSVAPGAVGRDGLEPSTYGLSPPARPTVAPGVVGRDGLQPSTYGLSPLAPGVVGRDGLEPSTYGLKVRCSTN
jgi:hypothetical protein